MKVLITGFEPFGGVAHNPSGVVLALLPDRVGGARLQTAVLPVDGQQIQARLDALYAEAPDLVLHTGVAEDRAVVTLETVAQNRLDYRIADNAGRTLRQVLVPGAPERLSTRLPAEAILAAWTHGGVPCAPSSDAGAFLCNQTFFWALWRLQVPVGFIHLPPDETLGALVRRPGLPLTVMRDALLTAAMVTLDSLELKT